MGLSVNDFLNVRSKGQFDPFESYQKGLNFRDQLNFRKKVQEIANSPIPDGTNRETLIGNAALQSGDAVLGQKFLQLGEERMARSQAARQAQQQKQEQGLYDAFKSTATEFIKNKDQAGLDQLISNFQSQTKDSPYLQKVGQIFGDVKIEGDGATVTSKGFSLSADNPLVQAGVANEGEKYDIQYKIDPNTGKMKLISAAQSKEDYRVLTAQEKKSIGLDSTKAFQIGSDGKITQVGGGGVNVNIGESGKLGPVPAGYVAKTDPETGQYYLEKVKGGTADLADQQQAKSTLQKSETVVDNLNQLEDLIKSQSLLSPITGVVSEKVPKVLAQKRTDAEAKLKTVLSNIGFGELSQMRKESPTGGAVGQVSDKEQELFQAIKGNLKLDQSEGQILDTIRRIRNVYIKAANYSDAEKYGLSSSLKNELLQYDNEKQAEEDSLPTGTVILIGGRKAVVN